MSKNIDDRRKQNNKTKKKHSFLKGFLIFISMLVLAVVVFVVTIKMISPDFDFSSLVPKQITSLVSGVVQKETQTQTESKPTTAATTTQRYKTYMQHEEFVMDSAKKGAFVGNILNGGKVDKDGSYIYHIVDGKGIYRFYTYNESYVSVYKTDETLSSLNVRGEYLYFVNENKDSLLRFNKRTAEVNTVAENIESAYLFGNLAYCVNSNNQVVIINVTDFKSNTIYTASAEEELNVVGISNHEVFFTAKGDSYTKYFVSDHFGREPILEFKEMTANLDVKSLLMEDGFMYYYQKQPDESYNLVRQKFGSEKTVVLVEDVNCFNPVIVDKNRVFYCDYKDKKLKLKELNMNSMKKKTMLSVGKVEEDHTLIIQHGGEYDFIIGKKSEDGATVYHASSNLTSSTNVMKFSEGSWKY